MTSPLTDSPLLMAGRRLSCWKSDSLTLATLNTCVWREQRINVFSVDQRPFQWLTLTAFIFWEAQA
jgi:hypothetical protein